MKKDNLNFNLEDLLGLDQNAQNIIFEQQNALPLAAMLPHVSKSGRGQ